MADAVASSTPAASSAPAPITVPKADVSAEAKTNADGSPFKGTKHKVIIDGAESEVDYDELRASYQKEKTSQKRFQEASEIKKATTELLQGLSSGDKKAWGWLQGQVPKDVFKQIAFDYAYQQMEYDSLPDDKKREMTLDERERRLKDEETKREETANAQQWQTEVKSAGDFIQKQLDEFVEKSGKQPSTAQLYRMTEYMLASIKKTGALPSIDSLYQYTGKQLDSDFNDVLKQKASSGADPSSYLPAEIVKAIKKSLIEQSEGSQPRRPDSSGEKTIRRSGEKKVGIDEAFTILEKRMKRR